MVKKQVTGYKFSFPLNLRIETIPEPEKIERQCVPDTQGTEQMKNFTTKVTTLNMATDVIYDERQIDHQNHSDRVWLTNHLHWAMRNNHGVQLEPLQVGDPS